MTNYNTNMTSVQQVTTPELYQFHQGFNISYYTSYTSQIIFQANTYVSRPIKRSGFKYDSNMGAVTVNITAAVLEELGRYVAQHPIDRTTVKILRTVADDIDNQYAIIFEGQIVNVSFKNRIATAKVVQRAMLLDQELNLVVYKPNCNHHIFDSDCGLEKSGWVVSADITNISGSTIQADEVSGYADNYFRGGEVHFGVDARLITASTGNTLTLHVPFDGRLEVGSTVDVYPGCDGDADTCINKFDNYSTFLGMPTIPSKNPAIWGV